MSGEWRTIDTYPVEARRFSAGSETDLWGPEVLVAVPAGNGGQYVYVAHLEADDWLVRDQDDPQAWGLLTQAPTLWAPLPDPPEDVPVLAEDATGG